MLASAYDLPYTVHYTPLPFMGRGRDISVVIVFAAPMNADAIADTSSLIIAFLHLAKSGALCGGAIAPWTSGIVSADQTSQTNDGATWALRGVLIDDLSAVILAQLFLIVHRAYPIRRVIIHDASSSEALLEMRKTTDDTLVYPKIYAPLASRVVISPHYSEDITIEATFNGELSSDEAAIVRTRLEDCIAAMSIGCYPIAPLSPDYCGLEYGRRMRFFEGQLDFALNSFNCHPDALNGLCNALFSAPVAGQKVLSVEID